jgi:hypothetical protein
MKDNIERFIKETLESVKLLVVKLKDRLKYCLKLK